MVRDHYCSHGKNHRLVVGGGSLWHPAATAATATTKSFRSVTTHEHHRVQLQKKKEDEPTTLCGPHDDSCWSFFCKERQIVAGLGVWHDKARHEPATQKDQRHKNKMWNETLSPPRKRKKGPTDRPTYLPTYLPTGQSTTLTMPMRVTGI